MDGGGEIVCVGETGILGVGWNIFSVFSLFPIKIFSNKKEVFSTLLHCLFHGYYINMFVNPNYENLYNFY